MTAEKYSRVRRPTESGRNTHAVNRNRCSSRRSRTTWARIENSASFSFVRRRWSSKTNEEKSIRDNHSPQAGNAAIITPRPTPKTSTLTISPRPSTLCIEVYGKEGAWRKTNCKALSTS